jgi:RNA polymerase sigma-70 factor (ECF subfamily)
VTAESEGEDAGAVPVAVRPRRASGTAGLEQLYATHFGALTMQLYAFTGDLATAQDVVQEAFCRALPRWSRLDAYDDPIAWIRRVAMNLATSRWRRARTARAYAVRQGAQTVAGPEPDRVALVAALKALPVKQRRVVVLHHLADQSVADIATSEGVPESTVRAWLHRGRAALAAALGDTESTEYRHA